MRGQCNSSGVPLCALAPWFKSALTLLKTALSRRRLACSHSASTRRPTRKVSDETTAGCVDHAVFCDRHVWPDTGRGSLIGTFGGVDIRRQTCQKAGQAGSQKAPQDLVCRKELVDGPSGPVLPRSRCPRRVRRALLPFSSTICSCEYYWLKMMQPLAMPSVAV